jgi:hypothetical protein
VYCDEIISSVGITLSSSQGWGQPHCAPGAIPSGQYVTVRWLVTPLSQEIYVDGQLRLHHNGDYSRIDRPVSIFTAELRAFVNDSFSDARITALASLPHTGKDLA